MAQPDEPGPSSFHLFSNLPPELRLHIWSLTVSPRIIDIYAFNKRLSPLQERNALKDDRLYTTQSSIPILYVCRESRRFALGLYKHGLDTEDQTSARFQLRRDEFPAHILERWNGCHLPCRKNSNSIPGEVRPRIYFNLAEDVFSLNCVWWFVGRHPLYPLRNYFPSEILLNLRYLALPFEMFAWAVSNDKYRRTPLFSRDRRVTLADFRSLREVIINVDCSEDERGERDPSLVSQKEITKALEGIAKRNPGWKIPKWRLVRDRASLGRVVERGLLT
jgi:hypothetical protein